VKAILLLGPTASGKSAMALALAREFPVEIVSVDSAQVYRGMDVGTAKPSAEERHAVPHHLIDIVEPVASYSAGRFRDDALRLCAEIHGRGRVPVLAGGTMLYFNALTEGLSALPRADAELRAGIEAEAAARGWPSLHADLAKVDPASALRIEPADSQRINRALEVFRLTGVPLSELQARRTSAPLAFATLRLSLEPSDRAVLHGRIASRFGAMLAAGLVDEVHGLRSRYELRGDLPSVRTVGYRQVWETIEGIEPAATLEARGIAATRQLAKRQLTWLRSMQGLERLDCLDGRLEASVLSRAAEFLGGAPH
jgi:tRNA dimethylallyltransferase